jgi:hypothetical protein
MRRVAVPAFVMWLEQQKMRKTGNQPIAIHLPTGSKKYGGCCSKGVQNKNDNSNDSLFKIKALVCGGPAVSLGYNISQVQLVNNRLLPATWGRGFLHQSCTPPPHTHTTHIHTHTPSPPHNHPHPPNNNMTASHKPSLLMGENSVEVTPFH